MLKTIQQKVKEYLKSGDSRKIRQFYNKVWTEYQDTIEVLERENKTLLEKIVEAKEAKTDLVFNLDLDRLKTVDTRSEYAQEHAQELLSYNEEHITPFEDRLTENKESIKLLKATIKYLKEVEPTVEEE